MVDLTQAKQEQVPESYTCWEIQNSFGVSQLKHSTRAIPKPKATEAVIKMSYASLNYRDLLMVEGLYNPKQALPLIPCSDGVGVVVDTGESCSLPIGTRVIPIFSQSWLAGEPTTEITRNTLGGPLDGTLGQYMCLDESGLVVAPEYLTDAEAATLGCAGLTAWSALFELGNLKSGERVLCIGTGGVSCFAAQLASAAGAEVILTSRSSEKLDRVKALGLQVDHMVHTSDYAWGKTIKSMTKGYGVDHVIEVGGAQTMTQSLKAVRPGGTISLIGILSGAAAPLNLLPILMRQIKVQGVIVGHKEGFHRMNAALQKTRVRPIISGTFDHLQVPQAFEMLKAGEHVGKICIKL